MTKSTIAKKVVMLNKSNQKLIRLAVQKSNTAIYAILIDDNTNKVIVSISSQKIKNKLKPIELAKETGLAIAKLASAKKISAVVFDRNGYKYHGRVKALAEGAREGGLKF
ncbi:MAG: 50S ribosomal protein L18 [bacterium ADurb.Bin212]|nr:MAG: 50S ribosomal protein L18 [bacterium ADurb.Bin212]